MEDLKSIVEAMVEAGVDPAVTNKMINEIKGDDADSFIAENILDSAGECIKDEIKDSKKAALIALCFLTSVSQTVQQMPTNLTERELTKIFSGAVLDLLDISVNKLNEVAEELA